MDTNILFAQASYLRKPQYIVLTKLIEKNGKKFIHKSPIYPEGKKHIQQILRNHKLIQTTFKSLTLPSIQEDGNSIFIEYIEKPNLESQIESFLIEGQLEEANSIIKDFIKDIQSIPSKSVNPYNSPGFSEMFDPSRSNYSNKKIDCIHPGLFDINLDNFILHNSKYYFIDFEWIFDFPIPKDYLILRSIYSVCVRLKRHILALASEEFPCINIYHDVLIPLPWISSLKHSPKIFQQVLDFEENLQSNLITAYSPRHTPIINYLNKPYVTHPTNEDISRFQETIKQIKNINRSKRDPILMLADLHKKTELLESENDNLSKQLLEAEKTIKEFEGTITGMQSQILNSQMEIDALKNKYDKKSYQILEKLESTKIAQFKPLRIFVRKTTSLFIRIINLFR